MRLVSQLLRRLFGVRHTMIRAPRRNICGSASWAKETQINCYFN